MLEEICTYEKTVELVGIVNDVVMKNNLLTFCLKNNDDIVQVNLWDTDIINSNKSKLITGNIIHIDSGFARPKNERNSKGTGNHDISIMSNTIITVLKSSSEKYVRPKINKDQQCALSDALKVNGTIEITAFIKNHIAKTSLPNNVINQGSITDGTYKLEVRMPLIYNMDEFVEGTEEDVIIKNAKNTMDKIKLIKGNKMLKRPLDESTN
ncbi:hypothetical protein TKK_0009197 [Trichogramma kaykai]